MPTIQPQPKILTVWRIVLVIATVPTAFFCSLFFSVGGSLWLLLTAVWILLFLGLYLFYLPMRYKGFAFQLEGDRVLVTHGVFYRRHATVPIHNIQYTTAVANPLERMFGLCSLLIVTPGARILIPGLSTTDAGDLAKVLTGRWERE